MLRDRTAAGTSNPYFASRSKTKPGRRLEWKRLPQLLDDPHTRRMIGDVKVQDAPTIVADHEEAVEKAESDRWDGEEVHRRNGFPMVAKENEPTSCRFLGARFIQREIVRSERSRPSMRSSPCILGAPQLGFSATTR